MRLFFSDGFKLPGTVNKIETKHINFSKRIRLPVKITGPK